MDTTHIINQVHTRHLTYLDPTALTWLSLQVRMIEHRHIPGMIVEAGCALGGSAIVIAATKNHERHLALYDSFAQIPPPSSKDGPDVHRRYELIASGRASGIGGNVYYGYQSNLLSAVAETFEEFGFSPPENHIRFVQGYFNATLFPASRVAFAHIDCDWYDSVTTCLERIAPLLSQGGCVVIDDYFSYSGCRDAVHDYFRLRHKEYRFVKGPRLTLYKTASNEPLSTDSPNSP